MISMDGMTNTYSYSPVVRDESRVLNFSVNLLEITIGLSFRGIIIIAKHTEIMVWSIRSIVQSFAGRLSP